MQIRRANDGDIGRINALLRQVLDIHHNSRPDIFKSNAKKYTDRELLNIIGDDTRPIFVYVNDENEVIAYAFCIFIRHENNNILTDIKSLYIDDLCVDKSARGMGVGKKMLSFVRDYAKKSGCYNLTLNVWAKNMNAIEFYRLQGLSPQKIYLEEIL